MVSALDNFLDFIIPPIIFTWMGFLFWKAAKKFGADKGIEKIKEWVAGRKKEETGAMEEVPDKKYIDFE